jgi:GT2 family glycosyltransferase
MNVSVIIPSYNPTMHLEKTVDSLIHQSKHIQQLVIVIDNEEHHAFADTLMHKYKNNFRLLTVHVQANGGRAKARNKGARISEGDLLFFLDDDMFAEKDLVEKHLAYHAANPSTIVIGNGYRNPNDAKDDFAKYIIKVEKSWHPKENGPVKVGYNNFNFTACNMSIPMTEFTRLGGFDEKLRDAEDFDFGARALKHAINIIYDSDITAWHSDWPDITGFIRRHNEYTKAKRELVKIHKEYLESFPALIPQEPGILKKIVLIIFKDTICKGVLHNVAMFRALPLSLRFLLYRLTISANSFTGK